MGVDMSDIVDEIFTEAEKQQAPPENTTKKSQKQARSSTFGWIARNYTNIALTIIMVLLCIIATKPRPEPFPNIGDFRAIAQIENDEAKREKHLQLMSRIPLVAVKGGEVEITNSSIEVTGEVSIVR